MNEEIWKPVPGWPYQASDKGRIRNAISLHVLKPVIRAKKYYGVNLSSGNGQSRSEYVHRLVLMAFMGPPPEGYEAYHVDGQSLDNRPSNLCWATHAENMLNRYNSRKEKTAPIKWGWRQQEADGTAEGACQLPPPHPGITAAQFTALEQSLRGYVEKLFNDLRKKLIKPEKPNSPWLDRHAAARFLHVSAWTVDLYKRQGKLDPRYVGKKPLYPVEQLQKLPSKRPMETV